MFTFCSKYLRVENFYLAAGFRNKAPNFQHTPTALLSLVASRGFLALNNA
jgi:hypothetical protein